MTRPTRTAALFAGVVARPGEEHLALAAGVALGAAGYGLRHGGYNGLMEAAAQGAAPHGVPVTAITLADRPDWGPFNPHVTDAVYAPTMGDRLHAYLDDVDMVVVMGGGVGTLHEVTAALYYATTIRPVPVRLLGQAARRLCTFLRDEQWFVEGPTAPWGSSPTSPTSPRWRRTWPTSLPGARDDGPDDVLRPRGPDQRRVPSRSLPAPDGRTLDSYFAPYRLAADPLLLKETAAALAGLLPPDTEVVARPALAAIPLVTAVSLHTGLPAVYVRAAPKEHGTWRQIEGADLEGRRTVLIDDTARSETSLLRGARLLRIAGARVTTGL
ncbi:orotate phosphoribosyltransferase [Streptomyces sp. NPDC051569]|uniref:orotate phosphoribosyltransferase n=1 Tax=Streptomyces sp. NPDC051569 TaxID=3365661 RepID=UPI003788C05F